MVPVILAVTTTLLQHWIAAKRGQDYWEAPGLTMADISENLDE